MERIDLYEVFPDYQGCLDVEIGFGTGLFGRSWASLHPQRHLIGLEIRKEAVKVAIQRSEALKNLALIHAKGEIFLEDCLEDESIDHLFLFHPDPWFKHYHHKRRVIQPSFLKIIREKLKKTGKFYISTDVEDLWIYMKEILISSLLFKEVEDFDFWDYYYKTEWNILSKTQKRSEYYGTFQII